MLWFSFFFLSLFWYQRQLLDWDVRIGNCNRQAKKGKEIRRKKKKKRRKDVEEGKKEKRKTDKEGKQENFYIY